MLKDLDVMVLMVRIVDILCNPVNLLSFYHLDTFTPTSQDPQ